MKAFLSKLCGFWEGSLVCVCILLWLCLTLGSRCRARRGYQKIGTLTACWQRSVLPAEIGRTRPQSLPFPWFIFLCLLFVCNARHLYLLSWFWFAAERILWSHKKLTFENKTQTASYTIYISNDFCATFCVRFSSIMATVSYPLRMIKHLMYCELLQMY